MGTSTPVRRARTARLGRRLRRPPAWLPWLLAAVGIVGLLLPWLLAPLMSDERYHYVAAPTRMGDNLLNVLPWTINDMGWRMRAGRIAPVGVFFQHVGYLLGMQFSFSTGIPLFVVHGIIKVLLLLTVVGSFALLLSQLRDRDGERIDRGLRRTATLVFAILLLLGVTATSPVRNGWTTFIVLCIGGVALMFLVGAASLWILRSWERWGVRARAAGAVALFLLGIFVMLSYEMHWAAIPFAVVLIAFVGRARWQHRVAVALPLGTGWLGAVLLTRKLIADAATQTYAGLELDLGGPVFKGIGLQLLNAIPGTGVPYSRHEAGRGLPVPRPFEGSGWLWGALLAVGITLLLRDRGRRVRADRAIDAAPEAPEPPPVIASANGRGFGDLQPLVVLAAALGTSALAAAVILSVSEQSHTIVRFVGATYRGTPWIWACGAGILTVLLLVLSRRAGRWHRALVVFPAAAALLVGAVQWPATVSDIRTIRGEVDYLVFDQAQAELVTGSEDPVAVDHRCRLWEQAAGWAEGNAYRQGYKGLYEQSFARQWGRPWCR